jgi:hypothetical protein
MPNKRAKGYAEERKAQVHMRGEKEGLPLDDYNKGLRSGYLLAQSDHTELYWYKQQKKAEEAAKADKK